MGHVIVSLTHAKEDVERASLSFTVANAALSAGQEVSMMLTNEGVWLATKGYADDLQTDPYPLLGDMIRQFVEDGGNLWVCGVCVKPRDITQAQLIPGAKIVGAAVLIEAMVTGGSAITF
ncbi:MAG: DsrE family protein [Anaerolineae bacterium]